MDRIIAKWESTYIVKSLVIINLIFGITFGGIECNGSSALKFIRFYGHIITLANICGNIWLFHRIFLTTSLDLFPKLSANSWLLFRSLIFSTVFLNMTFKTIALVYFNTEKSAILVDRMIKNLKRVKKSKTVVCMALLLGLGWLFFFVIIWVIFRSFIVVCVLGYFDFCFFNIYHYVLVIWLCWMTLLIPCQYSLIYYERYI